MSLAQSTKSEPNIYAPGEAVPASGIYRVVHYQHRLPHLTTITANVSTFPECRMCKERVRFEPRFEVASFSTASRTGDFAPDVEVDLDFPERRNAK